MRFNSIKTLRQKLSLIIVFIFLFLIFSNLGTVSIGKNDVQAAIPSNSILPENDVVRVSASVQRNPAQIQLNISACTVNFPANAKYTDWQYDIFRAEGESRNWVKIATGITARSYIDTNVKAGICYEYRVEHVFFSDVDRSPIVWRTGFVYTGIDVPATDKRGKIVLLVDNTYSNVLSPEINQLILDLIGDGWQVIRHDFARSAVTSPTYAQDILITKKLIVDDYQADPSNVKGVFLLGNVPIPYSGLSICPDGHPDHVGAWVADNYYGDMDGTWTDTGTASSNSSVSSLTRNFPNDGKFDQNYMPSDMELFVGRVDVTNLPSFSKSDIELMRQYLNKDHNYRHNKMTDSGIGYIHDRFVNYTFGGQYAWYNLNSILGLQNVTGNYSNSPHAFPIIAQNQNFEWYYGGGAGTYTGVADIFTTADCATYDPKAKFYMLFGSYFGDWNTSDNVLRAPLATSTGLLSVWGARPGWYFHRAAMDRPVGYSQLDTLKFNQLFSNDKLLGDSIYSGPYVNLLGDPTLRLQNVSPISNLDVQIGQNQCALTWTAPTGNNVTGYNIYRSESQFGNYEKVNQKLITETNYVDTSVTNNKVYYYMVRAQQLVTKDLRSYYTYSTGVYKSSEAQILVQPATPMPAVPTSIIAPTVAPTPTIGPTLKPILKTLELNKVSPSKLISKTTKISGVTTAKATVFLVYGSKTIKRVTATSNGKFTFTKLNLKKYKGKVLKLVVKKTGYNNKTKTWSKIKK